jgi:hypothetical protein
VAADEVEEREGRGREQEGFACVLFDWRHVCRMQLLHSGDSVVPGLTSRTFVSPYSRVNSVSALSSQQTPANMLADSAYGS